jgi:hypothetical protein
MLHSRLQALVMQYYRRGSLSATLRTLWYQGLNDVQRLRFGLQVRHGLLHSHLCQPFLESLSSRLAPRDHIPTGAPDVYSCLLCPCALHYLLL